jgi:hypothetical protein
VAISAELLQGPKQDAAGRKFYPLDRNERFKKRERFESADGIYNFEKSGLRPGKSGSRLKAFAGSRKPKPGVVL